MKCAKCGIEYSDAVFPLHISRCPGNTPTKFVVDEPAKYEKKEEPNVQKQEEKTQVKRSRGKR